MTVISTVLGHSVVLYAVLSAVNMLAVLLYCVLGANAVFRVQPRRNWVLYAAAAVLALIGGGFRPFAFSASLNAVRIWNVCTTLLPFVCVAFLNVHVVFVIIGCALAGLIFTLLTERRRAQ